MKLPTPYKCKHCKKPIEWQHVTHCMQTIIAFVLGVNLVVMYCPTCTRKKMYE